MSAAVRRRLLESIYGARTAAAVASRLEKLLGEHGGADGRRDLWSERDVWLITYPDQFQEPGEAPLRTLRQFVDDEVDWLTGLHVLPFYPWSSDDGFTVMDYESVDADYGTWADIEAIAADRRLAVDAVINHMSTESSWFRSFLAGEAPYDGFFRTADPEADLSMVVRPRTTPLLTPFDSAKGTRHVWTTFSADQADLDYRDPELLLRILAILLDYARHGASVIRLDAIGLLWKEEGTPSMHLPQTHAVIQLIRSCYDDAYPGTIVLTETNVPHPENVSYFGDGSVPEAHIVYQFALAPLTLHSLLTGDTSTLEAWAADMEGPPGTTYLNFLASHDGVGVRPAEGLLTSEEIGALAQRSIDAGGGIGERTLADGTPSPYELHCTWFDLVGHGYSEADAISRHLATHALLFAMTGVPALYVHSLFGSSNDHETFAATGRGRSLNRHKFADVSSLRSQLYDPSTRPARVRSGLRAMAAIRTSHPAFHPEAASRVLDSPPGVIAIERTAADGSAACVVVNLGGHEASFSPPGNWTDADGNGGDGLPPWSGRWLLGAR